MNKNCLERYQIWQVDQQQRAVGQEHADSEVDHDLVGGVGKLGGGDVQHDGDQQAEQGDPQQAGVPGEQDRLWLGWNTGEDV